MRFTPISRGVILRYSMGADAYSPCSVRMLRADINSSSVNESERMGVRTEAYAALTSSPSLTTYCGLRHHLRHCFMTPAGKLPTFRRRLPGKYPTRRSVRGTSTNQSHQTMVCVRSVFSRQ